MDDAGVPPPGGNVLEVFRAKMQVDLRLVGVEDVPSVGKDRRPFRANEVKEVLVRIGVGRAHLLEDAIDVSVVDEPAEVQRSTPS